MNENDYRYLMDLSLRRQREYVAVETDYDLYWLEGDKHEVVYTLQGIRGSVILEHFHSHVLDEKDFNEQFLPYNCEIMKYPSMIDFYTYNHLSNKLKDKIQSFSVGTWCPIDSMVTITKFNSLDIVKNFSEIRDVRRKLSTLDKMMKNRVITPLETAIQSVALTENLARTIGFQIRTFYLDFSP